MNNLPPEAWIALNTAFNVIGTIGTALIGYFVILQNRKITQSNTTSQENQETLKIVQEQINGNVQQQIVKAEIIARQYTPPRILIVDDSEDDLRLATEELKKFQCHIFKAKTAQEAETLLMENIGSARGWPFDFVLLDLRMPAGDSEEVLRLFDQKAARVPIIILTGQPEASAGMDLGKPRTWVTKPLTGADIKDLFDKHNIPYIDPNITDAAAHI